MPVLTPQQEDNAVIQLLALLQGRNIAFSSIMNIIRKLQRAVTDIINNIEP